MTVSSLPVSRKVLTTVLTAVLLQLVSLGLLHFGLHLPAEDVTLMTMVVSGLGSFGAGWLVREESKLVEIKGVAHTLDHPQAPPAETVMETGRLIAEGAARVNTTWAPGASKPESQKD